MKTDANSTKHSGRKDTRSQWRIDVEKDIENGQNAQTDSPAETVLLNGWFIAACVLLFSPALLLVIACGILRKVRKSKPSEEDKKQGELF